MRRLAIATYQRDLTRHIAFARKYRLGLEIQVYGYEPDLLDGDWRTLLAQHKAQLRGFEGELACHGAFYDMNSASVDSRIVALTRQRYHQNIQIAAELGARHVVFHANFLHVIRHPHYLQDWTRRQVGFWGELAEEAGELDVVIALENMWEPDPDVIARVLDQVDSPHLAACLDVGHAHLYSDSIPIEVWIERLTDRLVHCHINNNQGEYDEHLPLDAEGGIVDYQAVLPLLDNLPHSPLLCLEMDDLAYVERSLRYLGL